MKLFTKKTKKETKEKSIFDDKFLLIVKNRIFTELNINQLSEKSLHTIWDYCLSLEASLVNDQEAGRGIDEELLNDVSYVADELGVRDDVDIDGSNRRLLELK